MNVYECDSYLAPPVYTNRSAVPALSSMAILGSVAVPPLGTHVCYSVAVAAWNAHGVGGFSVLVSAKQGNARPGAPVITSSNPSDGMVSLAFTASTRVGGTLVSTA